MLPKLTILQHYMPISSALTDPLHSIYALSPFDQNCLFEYAGLTTKTFYNIKIVNKNLDQD